MARRVPKFLKNPVLIVLAVGAVAAASVFSGDKLDDVVSGVAFENGEGDGFFNFDWGQDDDAAPLSFHMALVDGANGTTLSSASADYDSALLPTASFAPASIGNSLMPLSTGYSTAGSCGKSMRLSLSEDNPIPTPNANFRVFVKDSQTLANIQGAAVEVYRLTNTTTTLIYTGTTTSKGEVEDRYVRVATAPFQAYYAKASAVGYCAVQSEATVTKGTTNHPTGGTSSTPVAGDSTPSAVVYATIGLTGHVHAINVGDGITVGGWVITTLPSGSKMNTSLTSVTLTNEGGDFNGVGLNLSIPRATLAAGKTTFSVTTYVRATSVECPSSNTCRTATVVEDRVTFDATAQPDAAGRIDLKASGATVATLALGPTGLDTHSSKLQAS